MAGLQWMARDAWVALAIKGEAPADVSLLKSHVAEIKAPEDDSRVLGFTISTGNIDRDRDVISPSGWNLAAYKKSPIVLWAHDYRQPPIARASKIRVEGNALKAQAEFATAEIYPFAETVFRLLRGGFLKATSVGFRPLKSMWNNERGGMDFEAQELLEFSIVPVPANSECLMDAKSAGIDVAPLTAWAEGVLKSLGHVWVPGADLGEKSTAPKPPDEKSPSMRGQMDQCMSEMDMAHDAMTKARTRMEGMRDMMPMPDDMPMRSAPVPAEKAPAPAPAAIDTQALVDALLASLEPRLAALEAVKRVEPPADTDDTKDVLALDDDDEDELDLTADEVRAVIGATLKETVTAEVRGVINALRGRVD